MPGMIGFMEVEAKDLFPQCCFSTLNDLSGKGREHWPRLPYHTIMITWQLSQRDNAEAVFKEISMELEALMLRLFGEDDE